MARFGSIGTQYFNNSGDPLSGGKLWFYNSGTTTLKDTYSDADESVVNANPVILDAAGRQPEIYFSGVAKCIMTDSADVQVEVRDPVGPVTAQDELAPWNAVTTYDPANLVLASDDLYYLSITANNKGNDPTSTSGEWMEFKWIYRWDAAYTYAIGDFALEGSSLFVCLVSNSNLLPSSNPTEWAPFNASIANGTAASQSMRWDTGSGAWVANSNFLIASDGDVTSAGTLVAADVIRVDGAVPAFVLWETDTTDENVYITLGSGVLDIQRRNDLGADLGTFFHIDPDGATSLYAGLDKVAAQTRNDGLSILGSTTTTDGGVQDSYLTLEDSSGTDLAYLGFINSSGLQLTNLNNGGIIALAAHDSAGVSRTGVQIDPDGNTLINYAGLLRIAANSAGAYVYGSLEIDEALTLNAASGEGGQINFQDAAGTARAAFLDINATDDVRLYLDKNKAFQVWTNAGGLRAVVDVEGLAVTGRIAVTSDPTADNHVGDRAYNDARYGAIAAVAANTAKVSASGSVTSHSDVTSAGSGSIITTAERNAITANTAKVSADGSVTSHSDVTSAGSGAIITTAERNAISANTAKVSNATHTGDVTGSTALTIAANAVTNAKAANMAESTIKGRAASAGTGDPTDLTATQVLAILGIDLAGVAVAGGKVISDGSGAQSVTNCWGVSACTISGNGFRFTLDSAIATDDDMVINASPVAGFGIASHTVARVSDTQFDVFVLDTGNTPGTASGVSFNFTVHNAGR